ncbi:MAG: (d)CMP kinase [Flavobacteriales bacterium]|nr:MAG: cytidylate kinase [Chlorobi bacterium OLB6]MBE2265556.1 (d)CMP kinase [Flavobacteriales bacterium]MBV6463232.1 Cytidylate kinase [Chlorobiota bacterium]MBW7853075.1 (d)CMP kinase [Candidatus Kapabacteria bacterium]MCC6331436.1 (d)CMP kinase [Ignavibacteria bacterium]
MALQIVITIDGPAGAGKSTTARRVAETLGYTYIDTGAMYRAVTLMAIRNHTPRTEADMDALAARLNIHLETTSSGQRTFVDSTDVTDSIRDPEVTNLVSEVSSIASVRKHLVQKQRLMGLNGGVVMDGRDIGSVVFPNAQVKVFLVADIEERTRRRFAELKSSGQEVSMDVVRKQLEERDAKDSQRENSPLIRPEGSTLLDTTHLTIEGQVKAILKLVAEYQRASDLVGKYFRL